MYIFRTVLCTLISFGGTSDRSFAQSEPIIYELPSITFVAGCSNLQVLEDFLDQQIEAGGFTSNIVNHTLLPSDCISITVPPEATATGWMRFYSSYTDYITIVEVIFTLDEQQTHLYSFELLNGL